MCEKIRNSNEKKYTTLEVNLPRTFQKSGVVFHHLLQLFHEGSIGCERFLQSIQSPIYQDISALYYLFESKLALGPTTLK